MNALVEFSNALAEVVQRAGKSVVAIREGGHNGVSATVWREGIIVAAEHTVRGRDEVSVVLPGGEASSAKVIGRDPTTEIVALKLGGGTAAVPEFAAQNEVNVGHIVLALGRRPESGVTASYGMVSAIGAAFRTWGGGRIDRMLRLDLSPYPGFSGGPLVDAQGRVLGINTSGPRRSVLTIPKETIDRVLDQLLKKGRIARGYLGIGAQPVTVPEALQKSLKLQEGRGLLVITVAPQGPAEAAGMMVGDILLALEGKPVTDLAHLQAALDTENVGKALRFRVLRGGSPTEISVTVGERGRDE